MRKAKAEEQMIRGLIIGTAQGAEWMEQLRKASDKRRIGLWDCLDGDTLRKIIKSWDLHAEDCFCVAETDEAVKAARELGIPCIAYCNPELEEQSFHSVSLLLEGFDEIDWHFLDNVYARESGLPVEIARTERLLIREMTVEDLDALYAIYDDEQVRRFVKGLHPDRGVEEEHTRAYIKYMYGLYQFGMWVLEDRKTGELIGKAGFGIADYRGESELDLGYLIVAKRRGQGYAREACLAILEYGREILGFSKVSAYVHSDNQDSQHLIRRLGFLEQGMVESGGEQLLYFSKDLQPQGD